MLHVARVYVHTRATHLLALLLTVSYSALACVFLTASLFASIGLPYPPVDEIDKLLEEEILPTIEKLRKERGDYMKWAAGNDSLERLRRQGGSH